MTSWWRVAAFALAVSVTHHLGVLTGRSGRVGPLTGYVVGGVRSRRTAGSLLLWAFTPALAVLAGRGLVRSGFPQPSSL